MIQLEPEAELPRKRRRRWFRCHRQKSRAVYRAIGFSVVVGGYCLIHMTEEIIRISRGIPDMEENRSEILSYEKISQYESRRLLEEELVPCGEDKAVDNVFLLIPYAAGVLYMFFAIAIVCDEFFVPALEEIASEHYFDLSMDVAGATLMAAGGSAPELFTSLIGTFQGSEVGFGTIVGSAVFNVLFVIGMCAMFSKDVLTLTWWPLARDCTYYAMVLSVLAIFCGYSSPQEIEIWEAAVLFCLYLGYVLLMKFNEKLWNAVKKYQRKVDTDESMKSDDKKITRRSTWAGRTNTFRAGLLNVITGKGSLGEKVGMTMVSKISGDVDTIFRSLDVSGDGYIDKDEFHKLLDMLGTPLTEEEIEIAVDEVDDSKSGQIDLKDFTKWYIRSEKRLKKELKETFDNFAEHQDTIDGTGMRRLLKELGTEVDDKDVQAALVEANIHSSTDRIEFSQFEAWYTRSKYWERRLTLIDNAATEIVEPISDHLKPPADGGLFDYIRWVVLWPIVLVLCITVPDVRQPGNSRLCFLAFLLSILWIGGFTYFMVGWAEVIGNTLGIPIVLMGLTVLAAGTSVPDLLSSVIVARMGEGDMAVSSSIGSNIFDITCGLPIPWLLFYAVYNGEKTITIRTEGMTQSIIILLIMLVLIVTIIHISGWKLTKSLGMSMFLLYFVYVAQAIVFTKSPCVFST